MSKRTSYSDNSKRKQPIQQQRAQAALQAGGSRKAAKARDQEEPAARRTQ